MAIKTLARVYKWPPEVLRTLYLDDLDTEGLYWWYEEAKQYVNDINASING